VVKANVVLIAIYFYSRGLFSPRFLYL